MVTECDDGSRRLDARAGDGEEALDEIVVGYIERLLGGEILDKRKIEKEHPDLAAEILGRLRVYRDFGAERDPAAPLGTLGDYTLLREVGRGGMGVVYESRQNSLDRRVALKVLGPAAVADARAIARFVREAHVAGQINHPNVVTVHALGSSDGSLYYAMELVEGRTLARVLAEARREAGAVGSSDRLAALAESFGGNGEAAPGEEAPGEVERRERGGAHPSRDLSRRGLGRIAAAFAGAAEGLQRAHQLSIVHRDIKPSNLILDSGGRLRILDFGLAWVQGQGTLTVSGQLIGTVLYMSPEQAAPERRRRVVDRRSDVYSLGASLYETLTGRPPLEGRSHQDTLSRIALRDPEPPSSVNPAVPRDLETIALKCLEKEPSARYATAEALAQDLRRFARGEPIEARPRPRWERAARRLWRLRGRLAVAACFLGLLLVVLYLLLRPGGMALRAVWELESAAGDPGGRISSDGRYLSYNSWDFGNLAVRDLVADTGWLLTANEEWASSGGWVESAVISPDGESIAYSWCREKEDEGYDLRIVDRRGTLAPEVLYRRDDLRWVMPLDWSADGAWLLLSLVFEDKRGQLAILSVADGALVGVLAERRGAAVREAAGFSPDGLRVAFDAYPPERAGEERRSGNLFLLDLDAAEPVPLVRHPADDRFVAWGPEGRGILFLSDRTGRRTLWWIAVEDGRPRGRARSLDRDFERCRAIGLTPDGAFYHAVQVQRGEVLQLDFGKPAGDGIVSAPEILPSLYQKYLNEAEPSPDGRSLAYRVRTEAYDRSADKWLLAIAAVETGRETILELSPPLSSTRFLSRPKWSPGGRRLVVTAGSRFERQLPYTIDVATGTTRPLAGPPALSAVWGADGRSLYLRSDGRITRRDLASGEEEEIHPAVSDPTLSPNGRSLAFYRTLDSLVILDLASRQAREVARRDRDERGAGGSRLVAWTPDGEWLLFVKRDRELWRVAAEGGAEEPVTAPLGGAIGHASLHPDGRQLLLNVVRARWQVWVLENFLP